MARIRTVKPEFFTSEDIVALTPLARLLYIALWCEADREGRFCWRPGTWKLRYFPGDTLKIDKLIYELTRADACPTRADASPLVVRYGNGEYGYIPSFKKHQHINPREAESKLPDPVEHTDACPTRADACPTRREEGKGREGKGRELTTCPEPVLEIPLAGSGKSHSVCESDITEYRICFPGIDVTAELLKCRAWNDANPTRRKTQRGIKSHIAGWLSRAQDRGNSGNNGGGYKKLPDLPYTPPISPTSGFEDDAP